MAANLRDDLKKKKPILGLERTLKKVRRQEVSCVYVASNSHAKEQLINLGKTMNIEVVVLEENSRELGVLCKKPFFVSVLSFE